MGESPKVNNEYLKRLKADLLRKHQEAVTAAYKYFCECDVGPERIIAGQIYENLRNATRL